MIDITDDDWRGGFETVFLGPLRVARAVAAGIGDEGGSMVFVLSSSVKQPVDGLATSNGLRPGVAMTAKTMADELGPRGIRVNGLLPGRVDTDRVRELDAAPGAARRRAATSRAASRCAATASRTSSAGRPRSCSRPRRRTSPA